MRSYEKYEIYSLKKFSILVWDFPWEFILINSINNVLYSHQYVLFFLYAKYRNRIQTLGIESRSRCLGASVRSYTFKFLKFYARKRIFHIRRYSSWIPRAEILSRGFHDQSDSSLLDTVDAFTYETALLVAHVLDTRIRNGMVIPDEELAIFILSEWWSIIMDQGITLN